MKIKKVKIGRWIAAIIVMLVINSIIHMIGATIGMGYYMNPDYFEVWSKIMMPEPGPPPASFMIYSIIFNLIASFIFVLVYLIIYDSLPGTGLTKKGLSYGLIIFMISGISGMLGMILLINLPAGLIGMWTVETLVINLLCGIFVALIAKPALRQKPPDNVT